MSTTDRAYEAHAVYTRSKSEGTLASLSERREWEMGNGKRRAAVSLISAIVCAALLLPASPGLARTNCVPAPEGLTGWWSADGTTSDVIGGRTATLHDGATFGPGLVGLAYRLDGVGDFVSVPDDPALNVGSGDFTVDLWVWFRSTADEQVLVEKYIQRFEDRPSEGWTFTKLETNEVGMFTQEWGVVTRPLSLRSNTWYHFAARRSGLTASILLNGRVVASGPATGASLDTTSSLKFGHRGAPADTPGSEDDSGFYLNGRIDEVDLFVGRAVLDGELRAVATAGPAGKC
jgi:concanavalin A-like lectin/glucanase superfamily protein